MAQAILLEDVDALVGRVAHPDLLLVGGQADAVAWAAVPLDFPLLEALDLHAIAAVLRTATGTNIHYVDTPLATVRDALSDSGMPQPMATAFVELHSVMATSKRAPVTSHVLQVTGRPPRSFASFAAEHAAAFDNQSSPHQRTTARMTPTA